MAKDAFEENEVLDKKAAKKAEKMKKRLEKQEKKSKKKNGELPETDLDAEKEEGGGKLAAVLVTILLIIIWVGILGMVVKLDVGGFGSTVLYPILKDVPYVNRILPKVEPEAGENVVDVQYPYTSIEEAVDRIKELELELSQAQEAAKADDAELEQLKAEIERLKGFESRQAEFEDLKTKFYQEVVFSDQAPDISEYRAYYESIDAANAAELYKQVVSQETYDAELKQYISTYSSMKAKEAAAILEQMPDDMKLVAKILEGMDADSRGSILGAMSAEFAAKLTKLMEPTEP